MLAKDGEDGFLGASSNCTLEVCLGAQFKGFGFRCRVYDSNLWGWVSGFQGNGDGLKVLTEVGSKPVIWPELRLPYYHR